MAIPMDEHSSGDVSNELHEGLGKRTRSRSGCFTCRGRKKRCDETKPVCFECQRLQMKCEYPVPGTERRNKQRAIKSSIKGSEVAMPSLRSSSTQSSSNTVSPVTPSLSKAVGGLPKPPTDITPKALSLNEDFIFPLHFSEKELDPVPDISQEPTERSGLAPVDFDTHEMIRMSATGEFGGSSLFMIAGEQDFNDSANGLANGLDFLGESGLSEPESTETQRAKNRNMRVKELRPVDSQGPSTETLRKTYPDLTDGEVALFEYSRDKLSLMVSVSPANHFRSVFLAISLTCRATLYAIMSYSAYYMNSSEVGRSYFVKATKLLQDGKDTSKLAKEEVLATILLLASAKIFSGDFADWRWYMVWAGQVIQYHGGIFSFMESESVRWLLRNFAYKEILTSASALTPTLFSPAEVEFIFSQSMSPKWPDSNMACCDPLFLIIATTHEMTLELRNTDLADEAALESIFRRTHLLEMKIRRANPDPGQLENLDETEKQNQLLLFNTFKLVALLHIYQAVLKSNSATLRVRYVNVQLLRALPDLLGTSVEALLMFPLFIAGITCADEKGRENVMSMFDKVVSRTNTRNVSQVQQLVRDVWEHDQQGNCHVDWNMFMDQHGVHPSFI